MQKKERPLLSIGMIVKNEARCLRRCLDALAPLRKAFPCELVIADTGSTDGTREIAAEYANILFDFPWVDDFSAARNAVLERCSGLWHLQVDADEYADFNAADLRQALCGKGPKAPNMVYVVIRNYQSHEMNEESYQDFNALRLFRRDMGCRYEGRVHESPEVEESRCRYGVLSSFILHHDGYAYMNPEDMLRKKRRNMPLLEKELERDPHNLMHIAQCLTGAYTPEQSRRFARMAVEEAEAAMARDKDDWRVPAAAFAGAILTAFNHKFPEIFQWAQRAWALFPASILHKVDSAYLCAERYAAERMPVQCLEALARYQDGLSAYEGGRYDQQEFVCATLYCATGVIRQNALLLKAGAHIELGQYDEALPPLAQVRLANTQDNTRAARFLKHLLALHKGSGLDTASLFKRAWADLQADESHGAQQRRESFLALCRGAFKDESPLGEGRGPASLFAALGPGCDLGRAGLMAQAQSREDAQVLVDAVEDWAFCPPEALANALRLGCALPASLYTLRREHMEAMAAGLARPFARAPEEALAFLRAQEGNGSLRHTAFAFLFTGALAEACGWAQHGSEALFAAFAGCAARYLEAFRAPALREEESLNLLAPMERLGAYCAAAKAALDAGDKGGYVRRLRAALQDHPAAKDMVSFLLDAFEKKEKEAAQAAASPELRALAAQVRTILAQYPPGDPAVEVLKSSPAYQAVAHLIEES